MFLCKSQTCNRLLFTSFSVCYSVIFPSNYLLKIIRRYFERRSVLYWCFPATFKLLRAENIQFSYGWCIMFLSSITFTFISAMAARASSAARDWQQDVGSLDRNNNGGSVLVLYSILTLIWFITIMLLLVKWTTLYHKVL